MAENSREVVWTWLRECGRSELLFSDVTRALVTQRRVWHRGMDDPRGEVRIALEALAADGCVSLSPTGTTGRGGRPGTRIEVVQPTHEERKP